MAYEFLFATKICGKYNADYAVLLLRYKKGKHKRYVNYYSSRTLKDAEGTALGDDGHDVAGEMNKRRSPFPPLSFFYHFPFSIFADLR